MTPTPQMLLELCDNIRRYDPNLLGRLLTKETRVWYEHMRNPISNEDDHE